MLSRIARLLVLVLAMAGPAHAAMTPDEMLDDPALEARARDLGKQLRCLVCQNQSIDESDADLAKDLRVLVRERLVAGDSDEAVLTYLTDRYGAFVRLRPPVTVSTIALWITPIVVTLIALFSAIVYLRGRREGAREGDKLSDEEERALAELMAAREARE